MIGRNRKFMHQNGFQDTAFHAVKSDRFEHTLEQVTIFSTFYRKSIRVKLIL